MRNGLRWAPHRTLGLRRECVALFLADPARWQLHSTFGPRQVQAAVAWLGTCGLVEADGKPGAVARMMNGEKERLAWELAWVNTVFSFWPAWLYVRRPLDSETTVSALVDEMARHHPDRRVRTIMDGVVELVSTLEGTPIGAGLGQGIVSPTRPRTIRRVGLAEPDPAALAYAMRRLFQFDGRAELNLEDDLMWPWVVFGCDADDTLLKLYSVGRDWLEVRAGCVRLLIPREELDELALF